MSHIQRLREVEALNSLVTIRRNIRNDSFTGHTAGIAPGYTQGNLTILPAKNATDFMRYCLSNPKPCPLVGVSDTGNPILTTLGNDIDIRTDIPNYNVYRNSDLVETRNDIKSL